MTEGAPAKAGALMHLPFRDTRLRGLQNAPDLFNARHRPGQSSLRRPVAVSSPAMAALSSVFLSSPQSRAVPVAAAVLSLLVHLLAALVWMWPDLPDRADDPVGAVAVEIVPAVPAKPAERAAEPVAPPPEAKAIPQLDDAPVAARSTAAPAPAPVRKAPPTRSERDRVLSQVVRLWAPPPALAAYPEAEFAVKVTVLADGTLAGAFSVRAPYDPAAAIDGYARQQGVERQASESFYRALRQAQPLRLPPALAAKAPFDVVLEFRVRDVVKR